MVLKSFGWSVTLICFVNILGAHISWIIKGRWCKCV